MRYRLRTLLIVLALGPPAIWVCWLVVVNALWAEALCVLFSVVVFLILSAKDLVPASRVRQNQQERPKTESAKQLRWRVWF